MTHAQLAPCRRTSVLWSCQQTEAEITSLGKFLSKVPVPPAAPLGSLGPALRLRSAALCCCCSRPAELGGRRREPRVTGGSEPFVVS